MFSEEMEAVVDYIRPYLPQSISSLSWEELVEYLNGHRGSVSLALLTIPVVYFR